mmetsp:Transcript_3223/g.9133  ORF Transcript_3223/g.9133 Transcript_3223/m.9133 type:complete len:220 (-) Transcript_3223:250-909(-)
MYNTSKQPRPRQWSPTRPCKPPPAHCMFEHKMALSAAAASAMPKPTGPAGAPRRFLAEPRCKLYVHFQILCSKCAPATVHGPASRIDATMGAVAGHTGNESQCLAGPARPQERPTLKRLAPSREAAIWKSTEAEVSGSSTRRHQARERSTPRSRASWPARANMGSTTHSQPAWRHCGLNGAASTPSCQSMPRHSHAGWPWRPLLPRDSRKGYAGPTRSM